MSARRWVQSVTPQDTGGGRPKLYAYGLAWIAEKSGRDVATVRRAVSSGRLDPADPLAVVAWCARAQGYRELGDALERRIGGST